MATIKHIAYTMYVVKDMKRARKFYEDILGLKLSAEYKGQWVEYHLGNGAFAITTLVDGVKPSSNSGGSIAFEVDDIEAYTAKLKKAGVDIKVALMDNGGCRITVFVDSEGNAVSIHQKSAGR